MIAGITSIGTGQVAQAQGVPYGDIVSEQAQSETNGKKGFGADIKACREGGGCGGAPEDEGDRGLGEFRASDEAGKSPGKPAGTRDQLAGNPNN